MVMSASFIININQYKGFMKKSLILSFGAVCLLGSAEAVAVKSKSRADARQWWNESPVPASDTSSSSNSIPASDTNWDDVWGDTGDDTSETNNSSSSIEEDIANSLSLDNQDHLTELEIL